MTFDSSSWERSHSSELSHKNRLLVCFDFGVLFCAFCFSVFCCVPLASLDVCELSERTTLRRVGETISNHIIVACSVKKKKRKKKKRKKKKKLILRDGPGGSST